MPFPKTPHHEPEGRAGCPQRGEAATKTERAHPGRSGAEVSRVGLSQSLSLVARCGQDGRAPKNRRGSRRFRQILIQPAGNGAKPPSLLRRGEDTAPYPCRTVQGFKARIGCRNSHPGLSSGQEESGEISGKTAPPVSWLFSQAIEAVLRGENILGIRRGRCWRNGRPRSDN